ncbi:MAG: hypothetical protein HRU19_07275 [Pseudobacteriovorax sp.]|nr:hypothetical protein [Pseudobacteriovorax sp.]
MWIDDQIIEHCSKRFHSETFVPKNSLVVLGRSNKLEFEVNVENCEKDSIAIEKRYGGGGTVLLHSGCIVISVGAWMINPFANDLYFSKINEGIIATINTIYPDVEICQRGFSDLVIGDKKIAGTSLFRSKNYLLYQASLLFETKIKDIERYLSHPSKEPDYREGRGHSQFLIGLESVNPKISMVEFFKIFKNRAPGLIETNLSEHLGSPNEEHFVHLRKRAGLV